MTEVKLGPEAEAVREVLASALDEMVEARDNLVVLTAWMAQNGYTPDEIAYAVEKPHKHESELVRAHREIAEQIVRDTEYALIRPRRGPSDE